MKLALKFLDTSLLIMGTGSLYRTITWKSISACRRNVLTSRRIISCYQLCRNRDWLYLQPDLGRNNSVLKTHYFHTVPQHHSNSIIKTAMIRNKFTT